MISILRKSICPSGDRLDLISDAADLGQLCHETARKAASEWMELDRTSRAEIETYFKRWNSREPWIFDS